MFKRILVLGFSLSLTACVAPQPRYQAQYQQPQYQQQGGTTAGQVAGTVLGGAAGAYGCSHFGGGSGQIIWAVACGIAGAFVGNEITKPEPQYAPQYNQGFAYTPNPAYQGVPMRSYRQMCEIVYQPYTRGNQVVNVASCTCFDESVGNWRLAAMPLCRQ